MSKICKNTGHIVAFAAIMIAFALGLSGCSSDSYAAKVNGTEISESSITERIESIRSSYSMEDDDAWGQYLVSAGTTPSELRDQILDALIEQEIVLQYAGDEDCAATDEEIDEQVAEIRAYYDSDSDWEEALQTAGFDDENDYRETLRYSIAYQNLQEKFADEAEASDEDVLSELQSYVSGWEGMAKKSSHILFDAEDEATAQEVLDKINSGELSFEDAAEQYSIDSGSAEDGGNVGWDKATSFVDAYQEALDGLNEGEMSGLVTSDYGIHIIKCTAAWEVPSEITSLDDAPEDIVETCRENVKSTAGSDAFDSWIEEKENEANIERKDMPTNVSYNIDLEKYQTEDSESSDSSADAESTSETSESSETESAE